MNTVANVPDPVEQLARIVAIETRLVMLEQQRRVDAETLRVLLETLKNTSASIDRSIHEVKRMLDPTIR